MHAFLSLHTDANTDFAVAMTVMIISVIGVTTLISLKSRWAFPFLFPLYSFYANWVWDGHALVQA